MKKNADNRMRRFLASHFGLPLKVVKPEMRLNDLHKITGDLHCLASLPFELERRFGVVLDDKKFDRISRGNVRVKSIPALCRGPQ